ncbi:hypothetical protein BGZ70_009320, partial [Mortierella alpina]
TRCFIEQYGNYTIKGPGGKETNVNGWTTLGENIADNGGIKLAFEAWRQRYRSDRTGKNHSPKEYRINGVVQNSAYFANAFKCKSGTPLNPVKKCILW